MRTIFVSSTFKDMQAERDAIREITAPLLNKEARKYNEEFDFCDLRWGINTAELESNAGSRKVLEVCLDEIDRCKPPMVVLLGYRYGWIPDDSLIKTAAERKKMELEDLRKSVTALEIEYGSLRDAKHFSNTLFYFREMEGDIPSDYRSEDQEHAAKIAALKERIRSVGGGRIKTFTLHWNGTGFDGVNSFAEMLAEDIKELLLPQWEQYAKFTPFGRERRIHMTFIEDKAAMFRARSAEAEMLAKQIDANPVTIIKGAVGSGKSTLFCHLVQQMSKTDWVVLPFISGLTPKSNDVYDIIENTVYFLENLLEIDHLQDDHHLQTETKITHTIDEWRNRLAEMCELFSKKGNKFLIMLDAVDQLTQSEARDMLHFIPMNAGTQIHFAMTCTTDFPTPGREFYTLRSIDDMGKREVIEGTLKRAGRELSKSVIKKMIELKSSENPLYLSLLVQRLLMMNREDFDDIRKKGDGMSAIEAHQIELINNRCPDELDEMSAALLTEAGSRIHPELILKAGQFLAVSRSGLRRHDLSALIGKQWSELDFSHFISYMNDCFMLRDDGRYDFTHKSIRAGFLKLCPDVNAVNRQILDYLKALPVDDNVRLNEIIYHTIKADDKAFFVGYIIEHENSKNTSAIIPAMHDTYQQCMIDNGQWLCKIITSHMLFETENAYGFIDFINFDLSLCFTGTQKEWRVQLDLCSANMHLAEYTANCFPNDHSKRSLALSYITTGSVFEQLGGNVNLQQALCLYEQSLSLLKELENTTGTYLSKRDLSIGYTVIARIYEKSGGTANLSKAMDYYEKSLGISESLYNAENTHETRSDLSITLDNIADIHRMLGSTAHLKRAQELFEKSLSIRLQLVKSEGTYQRKRELSLSYLHVGDVYTSLGGADDLKKALEHYQEGLQLMEQVESAEKTYQNKRDLAVFYERIATIHETFGNTEDIQLAAELYEKELELYLQLEKTVNTNASKIDLAVGYERSAGIYEQLGGENNNRKALELYQKSVEIFEWLEKKEGTNQIKRSLSTSYKRLAAFYKKLRGTEHLKKALELYHKDLELSEQLYAELGAAESGEDLLISYENIVCMYEKLGDEEYLQNSLEKAPRIFELSAQLEDTKEINKIRKNLAITYHKIAKKHRQPDSVVSLEKAFELFQKISELFERIAESEQTIDAYDNLMISLYNLAMHEYADSDLKKTLLLRAQDICKMLYERQPDKNYEEFSQDIQQALLLLSKSEMSGDSD